MQEITKKKSKKITQLSKNVRFLIAKSHLSQKEYAAELGIPDKRFNHYLTGYADFPTELFMRIAGLEGVSPTVLFYAEMETATEVEDLLKEPDEVSGYKKQPGTAEQALTTIERLTGMLDDCMKEKERLRGRVV